MQCLLYLAQNLDLELNSMVFLLTQPSRCVIPFSSPFLSLDRERGSTNVRDVVANAHIAYIGIGAY